MNVGTCISPEPQLLSQSAPDPPARANNLLLEVTSSSLSLLAYDPQTCICKTLGGSFLRKGTRQGFVMIDNYDVYCYILLL